ncbi:MAG: ATP synthase subunit I [Gammaproteobacteria bacterium]|nr:ATP synthase subunit I [Gammaproteobacteria bacterium]MDH5800230.1 ATP synthase subunit I [Gammaproteobacteria bacterium]
MHSNNLETALAQSTRRVVGLQLLSSVVIAVLFLFQDVLHAASALFGGLTSVSTALILSRGVRRAGEAALSDPKKSLAILMLGALQRFILVLGLLALGLGLLKLDPVAVIVGFVITQISYAVSTRSGNASQK